MSIDLNLTQSPQGYALADPTDSELDRVRNRFTILFLSCRKLDYPRGSYFQTELSQGKLKTNSDIVSIFALTASSVIRDMRTYSEDITPTRAELNSFTFVNAKKIVLQCTLFTGLGTVQETIEVTA